MNGSTIKEFLKFCRYEFMGVMVLFTVVLYCIQIILSLFGRLNIWCVYLIAIIISVIIMAFSYKKNEDYFEQLYVKVCMEYKTRDDYKNYVAIKDVVVSYNFKGKVDIQQNIVAIQACLDRDQAYSIYWSVLLTAAGVFVGFLSKSYDLPRIYAITTYFMILLVYMQSARRSPRNTFIKKVIENIDVNNISK